MNFWISLLGAALAVAPGALRAQTAAPATISGQLTNVPDSATITVFEPMPGVALNYFFTDGPNEAVVRGGRFRYQLRHAEAGFVRYGGKVVPYGSSFVEPGAQVTFTLKPGVGNALAAVTFGGTNAAANNLIEQGKLLNGGPPDGQRITAVLTSAGTAKAALVALQAEMTTPKALLTMALRQHQISQRCYDVLTAEVEQRLLFWAANTLLTHFAHPAENKLRMPDPAARWLAAALATQYDPALPRYRRSALGNLGLVAGLREKGVLPGPAPTAHTWAGYGPQFAQVNTALARYDYLPPAARGQAIGDVLLTALAFNAMSPADFARVFASYRRLAPTSPYGPIIARALPKSARDPAIPSQNQTFGRFETGARALTFAPAPGLDTVRTLAGLVRQQFAGRPVFIDFWASWCGPCMAEFRFEPGLAEFARKNGIDVLYIALDQPGFRAKWAALAAKNQLRGYHYLASPAVQESLKPVIPYIPRFMLFDKNSALVEASAYHPSAGDKLYQQLRERLKLP